MPPTSVSSRLLYSQTPKLPNIPRNKIIIIIIISVQIHCLRTKRRPATINSCLIYVDLRPRNWRSEATKTLIVSNDVNGIVERIQWNCSTKSMESFNETNGFVCRNWRFLSPKPPKLRPKSYRFLFLMPAALHE